MQQWQLGIILGHQYERRDSLGCESHQGLRLELKMSEVVMVWYLGILPSVDPRRTELSNVREDKTLVQNPLRRQTKRRENSSSEWPGKGSDKKLESGSTSACLLFSTSCSKIIQNFKKTTLSEAQGPYSQGAPCNITSRLSVIVDLCVGTDER